MSKQSNPQEVITSLSKELQNKDLEAEVLKAELEDGVDVVRRLTNQLKTKVHECKGLKLEVISLMDQREAYTKAYKVVLDALIEIDKYQPATKSMLGAFDLSPVKKITRKALDEIMAMEEAHNKPKDSVPEKGENTAG